MRISLLADLGLNVILPLLIGCGCYLVAAEDWFPLLLRSYAADALWAYAFMSLLLIVWERKPPRAWLPAPFAVAACYEAAQGWGWLPGTADAGDLLAYASFFTLALLTNKYLQVTKTELPS